MMCRYILGGLAGTTIFARQSRDEIEAAPRSHLHTRRGYGEGLAAFIGASENAMAVLWPCSTGCACGTLGLPCFALPACRI